MPYKLCYLEHYIVFVGKIVLYLQRMANVWLLFGDMVYWPFLTVLEVMNI